MDVDSDAKAEQAAMELAQAQDGFVLRKRLGRNVRRSGRDRRRREKRVRWRPSSWLRSRLRNWQWIGAKDPTSGKSQFLSSLSLEIDFITADLEVSVMTPERVSTLYRQG